MREILETLLTREGYERAARRRPARKGSSWRASLPFDAAIVDMMMPGMDGIATLDELKKIDEDLPVLMITAFASVESAIAAMKRGAFDYITKPFKNDEVLVVVRNAHGAAPAGRREPRRSGRTSRSGTTSSRTSSAAARGCGRCST